MSTVINNPGENNGNGTSGGAGVVIGAVIVILVLVVVVIYALPYVRGRIDTTSKPVNPTINVQVPNLPTPNINVQVPSPNTSLSPSSATSTQ